MAPTEGRRLDARLTGYDDRTGGTAARAGARRRARQAAVLGVVALAVLGYAAFEFAGNVTSHGAAQSASAAGRRASQPVSRAAASASAASAAAARAAASAKAAATPTATAPRTAAAPQVRTIVPVSAEAFGPDGTADGDNPQTAGRVLADPASGWLSQWYATPNFGDLKQGTGLLLDMGRTVNIATVRLTLGGYPGANLELRLGSKPELGSLPIVASASNAGTVLSLPLKAPVRARYVLLWFTKLPPDGAGTYQAFVHGVTVQGQP
jgi:hypothetical protein